MFGQSAVNLFAWQSLSLRTLVFNFGPTQLLLLLFSSCWLCIPDYVHYCIFSGSSDARSSCRNDCVLSDRSFYLKHLTVLWVHIMHRVASEANVGKASALLQYFSVPVLDLFSYTGIQRGFFSNTRCWDEACLFQLNTAEALKIHLTAAAASTLKGNYVIVHRC